MNDPRPRTDLSRFLNPRGVAVVGVSKDPGRIGGQVRRYIEGKSLDELILVRDELPGVHGGLGPFAQVSAGRDLGPQQVAGGHLRNFVLLNQ